jgi:hypothetical protein
MFDSAAGCKTLDIGEATFAVGAAVRPTDAVKTSIDPTDAPTTLPESTRE